MSACIRQVLLARYSAQDDIVVGTPYANRSMPQLKQLAGCMVNTLALRTSVDGKASFRQLLMDASKTAREAFSHAEAPFAMVVDALKQPRSASFTPVYQVSIMPASILWPFLVRQQLLPSTCNGLDTEGHVWTPRCF